MARTRSKRGEGSAKRYTRAKRRRISKLRQAAGRAAAAAVEASMPKPITLEGFATLPFELRRHIVEVACAPALSYLDAIDEAYDRQSCRRPSPHLDFTTARNLHLACKSLYGLVAPLTYSRVWLSRPSALASFHLAVSTRPALGLLVKSLHVGPDQELTDWSPLQERSGAACASCGESHGLRTFITTSLKDWKEEVELLPPWCHSQTLWALDYPADNPHPKAVFLALLEAQSCIDVDLQLHNKNHAGARISRVEHTIRLCEVQAALDLYLMGLRRWMDERGLGLDDSDDESEMNEEGKEETNYPALVLTGYSSLPGAKDLSSSAGEPPIIISRSQLLQHLARRGSIHDNFNHPLVFARSGLELSTTHSYRQRRDLTDADTGAADFADVFSPSPASFPDYALPNTASVAALVAMLRATLSYTSALETLSFTGFLEAAVCGPRPMAFALPKLRHLSLGPSPTEWYAPLRFDGFPGLEELRIAGIALYEEEAEAIVTKLPTLRRIEWSLMQVYPQHRTSSSSLARCIDRLVGRKATTAAEQATTTLTTSSSINVSNDVSLQRIDEPDDASLTATSTLPPLVHARLDPFDLTSLHDNEPSRKVRQAWTFGLALPGIQERRLLLEERNQGRWLGRTGTQQLYREGREWWEERRAGRGARGRAGL